LEGARGENGGADFAEDVHLTIGGGEIGVAAEIVIGKGIVPERTRILGAKPVAPVVPIAAKLGGATLGLHHARVGVKTKVPAAHNGIGARAGGAQFGFEGIFTVVPPGGHVDPVVESPAEAIGP